MADEAQLTQALINADKAGDADAARILAAEIQKLRSAPSQGMRDSGATWGAGNNFSSGVLQGMGDEVKAVGAAIKESAPRWLGGNDGLDFGNAYDQAKTMYQGARKKYADENPVTATVTDVAGQAAPWVMGAGPLSRGVGMVEQAVSNAAPRLAPAISWLNAPGMTSRMTATGLGGAGIGAASGFTNAEGGLGDRASGAGHGAMIGALTGAGSVPAIDAVSAVGRGTYNQIAGHLPFGQETVARRKIAEALAREGLTPDQALARMSEIGPDAALMDVGRNPRSLMAAAYQTPGEGKQIIGDFLQARQEGTRNAGNVLQGGQVGRIGSMLDDIVPERYRGTMDDLARQRRIDAKPLYDEAFAFQSAKPRYIASTKPAPTPGDLAGALDSWNLAPGQTFAPWDARLQQFLDDPLVKQGMAKGIRVQQLEALADNVPFRFQEYAVKGFNPDGSLIIDGTPNLRAMDAAKRGIDEMLEAYRDKTTGKLVLDDMGRAMERVRKSLVSKLDEITTDEAGRSAYREARQAWAGPSALRDALATGREILGGQFKNADDMAARIKDMTPDELHYMRIGAVQDLRDKIGNVVTRGDATKQLMEKHGLEDKVRLAFGDDATFRRYIDALKGEREMFDSYAAARGNSLTAERNAAIDDMRRDPSRIMQGLQRMASGNPLDWIGGGMQALGGAKDRIMMPEGLSREMAKVLVGQDVGPLRQAHQAGQLSQAQRAAMARALTATLAPGHGQ